MQTVSKALISAFLPSSTSGEHDSYYSGEAFEYQIIGRMDLDFRYSAFCVAVSK